VTSYQFVGAGLDNNFLYFTNKLSTKPARTPVTYYLTSMKENYLGTPVSPILWQTYHDLAIEKGQTLEDLVTAALYDYLEWKIPTDSESALLKEVGDLKEKVKELETLKSQVNRLNLNVQILENKLEYLSTHQTDTVENASSPINHSLQSSDSNEDDYDEPDEVLWDFISE
jgi:hypothetical protein